MTPYTIRLFVSFESPEPQNLGFTKFIEVVTCVRVIMEYPTPMGSPTCISGRHQLPGKILARKQWRLGRAILTSYVKLYLFQRQFEDKKLPLMANMFRYYHTPTPYSRMLLLSPITPGFVGTVSVGIHLIQTPLIFTIANTKE